MSPVQLILDFFKEMLNRVATKSPAFFKVLMLFAASLTLAGYIPSMLQQWFNVEVSGGVINFCEAIAKYATGFFIASGLSAKNTVVGQTEKGIEVKVTDKTKMPFSAKIEQKEIAKKVPPPEVLEEVPDPTEVRKRKIKVQLLLKKLLEILAYIIMAMLAIAAWYLFINI